MGEVFGEYLSKTSLWKVGRSLKREIEQPGHDQV
jgi:hypothetical protein